MSDVIHVLEDVVHVSVDETQIEVITVGGAGFEVPKACHRL